MAFLKHTCLTISVVFCCGISWGQIGAGVQTDQREYGLRSAPNGWMQLAAETNLSFENISTEGTAYLQLPPELELILEEISTDELGLTHARYQQAIQGVKIYHSDVSILGYGKTPRWVHGRMLPSVHLDVRPHLSEASALKQIQRQFPNVQVAWLDSLMESGLQSDLVDPQASYFPQGILEILPLRLADKPSFGYALCWRFDVRMTYPDDRWRVWVDARNGKVWAHHSHSRACNSHRGTYNSTYYGTRGFDLRKGNQPGDDYVLKDCRGEGIHTKSHRLNRFGETGSWAWTSNLRNRGSDWRSNHSPATTSHWATQFAWDYFAETFEWEGPHDEGLPIRIWSGWQMPDGSSMPNARYLFDQGRHYLYVGAIGNQSLATLDIIGHEFAHGLIEKTAGLHYAGESGALNESFADIFGTLVERSVLETEFDWVIGSELGGLRSLERPQDFMQPRQYGISDPFWAEIQAGDCGPGDFSNGGIDTDCQIHINSGVQNRWFYLLSQGGTQLSTEVFGIGIDRSAQIVFRILTHYLLPEDTYADARMASIQAAADLYGECSNELAQVKNAWAAVGVGGPNLAICADIVGANDICEDEPLKELTYEARAVAGASFTWEDLPLAWGYYISGEQNQYLTLTFIPEDSPPLMLKAKAVLGGQEIEVQKQLALVDCKTDTSSPGGEGNNPRLKFPEVRLIPNPSRDHVLIYLPEGRYPAQISIYDIQGRLLEAGEVTQSEWKLSLQNWAEGTYLIQVIGGGAISHHRMLHLD